MTVSGLDTSFDNLCRLPTLFDHAVNVSSADDFTSDLCPCLLSYHRCCPYPSPHQAVNVSSIDKPTDHCSCFMSSSTSNQTPVGNDTSWIYNPHPCYSYNFCHHCDMIDNFKTMNQELLRSEDWVPLIVSALKKEFTKLLTIIISMIGAALFDTLVQWASHAKNMEIFSISIRNIGKP